MMVEFVDMILDIESALQYFFFTFYRLLGVVHVRASYDCGYYDTAVERPSSQRAAGIYSWLAPLHQTAFTEQVVVVMIARRLAYAKTEAKRHNEDARRASSWRCCCCTIPSILI